MATIARPSNTDCLTVTLTGLEIAIAGDPVEAFRRALQPIPEPPGRTLARANQAIHRQRTQPIWATFR